MSPHLSGKRIVLAAALVCALAAFWACGMGPGERACGTEVPDPDEALWGCADNSDGGPAVGVRVVALPSLGSRGLSKQAGTEADTSTDSAKAVKLAKDSANIVYTDKLGLYHFGAYLPAGTYNLRFEELEKYPGAPARVQWYSYAVKQESGGNKLPTVTLRIPRPVNITVTDERFPEEKLEGAHCVVDGTNLLDTTTSHGVALFQLPPGAFTISCFKSDYASRSVQVEVLESDKHTDVDIALGSPKDDPGIPPPEGLTAVYDSGSGVTALNWSIPLYDAKRARFGLRRIDLLLGGGPEEIITSTDTNRYYNDANYSGKNDSVQLKVFVYKAYSLRKDGLFIWPSAPAKVFAVRPLAFGPRISMAQLEPQATFRAGDTAHIVATWKNALRSNQSLLWRQKGLDSTLTRKTDLAQNGSDTLAFRVPGTGDYELGISIRDSEGYVSWASWVLHTQPP